MRLLLSESQRLHLVSSQRNRLAPFLELNNSSSSRNNNKQNAQLCRPQEDKLLGLQHGVFLRTLITCCIPYCDDGRTSSKSWSLPAMRSAPTHKFPTETIDRVTNEGGQGKFWIEGPSFFFLGCSFITSVHVSESIP